jgi:hypothetical protein
MTQYRILVKTWDTKKLMILTCEEISGSLTHYLSSVLVGQLVGLFYIYMCVCVCVCLCLCVVCCEIFFTQVDYVTH